MYPGLQGVVSSLYTRLSAAPALSLSGHFSPAPPALQLTRAR